MTFEERKNKTCDDCIINPCKGREIDGKACLLYVGVEDRGGYQIWKRG